MHSSLALYLSKLGESDQALLEINKALKLDSNHSHVLQNAVVVYELSGRREQALLYLRELIERHGAIGELIRDPFLSELYKDPAYSELVMPRSLK